jgi:glycosyltransferase involved in cell wall biosynthesis
MPLVSIIVEAYNEEANALAPPEDSFRALLEQDFPLEQMEVILIGSEEQIAAWRGRYDSLPGVQRVRMLSVAPGDSHYWRLKNRGVEAAEGEIVGFVDCDAIPTPAWLSSGVSAIGAGADGSVGPSLYRTDRLGPNSPWMLAAALPSWSFVLAFTSTADRPVANSLMSHNVIIRREWLLRHPFPEEQRSFGSSLEYFRLKRAGAKLSYQPAQRIAHGMNFQWWFTRMHFRRGWESYQGRNLDPSWPRLWIERLPWIEPVALRMGLVLRDARHWFRFSRAIGIGPARRFLLWPLAIGASFLARSSEMAGMYAALIKPEAFEYRARF